jgi:hypothetical protein
MILWAVALARAHGDKPSVEGVGIELYGEANAEWLQVGAENPYVGDATLRRFTLEVVKEAGPIELLGELEWENAIACDGCRGSVEVEQGLVTWEPSDRFALDAGLMLVPFGVVNVHHEPGDFMGVERPSTDTRIVPSTWREIGIGVRTPEGGVRWHAAVLAPPDPTRLGSSGLAPTSSFGSHARLNSAALAGRFEVEPLGGNVLGLNAYATNLGPNGDFYDAAGDRLRLFLPLYGAAIDLRLAKGAFELRGQAVAFFFPEAGTLMSAHREDGSPWFGDDVSDVVPTRWQGAYVQGAVDFLALGGESPQRLLGFVRPEVYDNTAAVPDGAERDPSKHVTEWTVGAEWWPVEPVGIKADVMLRDRELGLDERQIDLGLAWVL